VVPKSKELTEQQLAKALEVLRLENRWSYRELGDRVGLSEPTIRRFVQLAGERGFHETTVYPIRKYVSGLGQVATHQEGVSSR